MIYTVYVQTNKNGCITDVNSSEFLTDLDGWIEIDRGRGYRYHHAQGNYFPVRLMDDNGVYRYKLVDDVPLERTQAEMDADRQGEDNLPPTLESRVETLENSNAELIEAVDLILSGVTE